MSYTDLLIESAQRAGSLFCLGIDPVIDWFPGELAAGASQGDAAIAATTGILDAALDGLTEMGALPAAFKPNIGYFVRHDRPRDGGFAGSRALAAVLDRLRERAPGVPVILDAKRGDIARSSANYAAEAYGVWGVDAVTVSPWMGDDSVTPFLSLAAERGSGVYVLARTSNPGAARFQNLMTEGGGDPVYRRVLAAVSDWDRDFAGDAGVVLGATAPEELRDALTRLRDQPLPILIPGVGGQGGSIPEILKILEETGYPPQLVRINASSAALFPWARRGETAPTDWRAAVADAVCALHHSLAIGMRR